MYLGNLSRESSRKRLAKSPHSIRLTNINNVQLRIRVFRWIGTSQGAMGRLVLRSATHSLPSYPETDGLDEDETYRPGAKCEGAMDAEMWHRHGGAETPERLSVIHVIGLA